MMRTPDGEPGADPWVARPLHDVVAELLTAPSPVGGRPVVLAVDGRSAGGKSSLGARIAGAVARSALVHTDDIAWYESFFGWDQLLARNVLEPLRRGEAVAYRPPAWAARGREGAIVVPAGLELVVVEGVGASRRSLLPVLDGAVWVQSDFAEARRRGLLRDGGDVAVPLWEEWMAQELPFLADDRPWTRAQMIICGTPYLTDVPHRPDADVLTGRIPQ